MFCSMDKLQIQLQTWSLFGVVRSYYIIPGIQETMKGKSHVRVSSSSTDPSHSHYFDRDNENPANQSIFIYKIRSLDGLQKRMRSYHGKRAYIIVNISLDDVLAFENITELNALYRKYQGQLEIVAFLNHDFIREKPMPTIEEVQSFISKYNIQFPVMGQISCGEDPTFEADESRHNISIHPLYDYLVHASPSHLPVEWNFAKFLCDGKGHVVGRYPPYLSPMGMENDIKRILNDREVSYQYTECNIGPLIFFNYSCLVANINFFLQNIVNPADAMISLEDFDDSTTFSYDDISKKNKANDSPVKVMKCKIIITKGPFKQNRIKRLILKPVLTVKATLWTDDSISKSCSPNMKTSPTVNTPTWFNKLNPLANLKLF